MKIAFFSAKPYEKPFFQGADPGGLHAIARTTLANLEQLQGTGACANQVGLEAIRKS